VCVWIFVDRERGGMFIGVRGELLESGSIGIRGGLF